MYKPTETMCNGFLMIGNKKAPTFSGWCFPNQQSYNAS